MIVVFNGRVVTRDDANPFINNGAVAMDGNLIVEVGESDAIKNKYKDAEMIDAKGAVVMPAFINMHEHIYSALARGLNIKGYVAKDFFTILDGMWWTLDRNLDNEFTKYSAIQTYIECIKNGCTTVFDHHASFGEIDGSLDAIEEAARELGVRSCLCYEISDRDGMEKSKKSVLENSRFIKKTLASGDDFIKAMCGMHAQFTMSDETFAFARSETPKEVGFHIHVAEGIEDLHDCLHKHGKRIVDRLDDFDILGPKTLLGHCIYINSHEMDRIKDTDTMELVALQRENAELKIDKEDLIFIRNQNAKCMCEDKEKLTKAKEIIKYLLSFIQKENYKTRWDINITEAEQFLSEVEK